jgi:hypothetical protein
MRQLPDVTEALDDPDAPLYGTVAIKIHGSIFRRVPTEPLEAIAHVIKRLAEQFGYEAQGSADEEEAFQSSEAQTAQRWTVAQLSVEDYGISQGVFELFQQEMYPDFFTQAVWALEELVKAYRLLARAPLADFTYRSLYPVMISVETDLDGVLLTPPTAWTLESVGQGWVESDVEEAHAESTSYIDSLERTAARFSAGDPFVKYSDRLWRAERHAHIEGQYDLAVLQAAIAIEGLLVASWLATQWEGKVGTSQLALERVQTLAGKTPTKAVLGWLSAELGGHWDPVNCDAARRWQQELQLWRNEVVHTGKSPGRSQALQAIEICRALALHVTERVANNFHKFPRTALLIAGHARLKRDLGKRVARFMESSGEEEPFFLQFTSWLSTGLAVSEEE